MTNVSLPRIIVAEDHEAVRDLIALQLSRAGYRVFPASDGVRAFALMRDVEPDALLLDINMPRLDGPGVLAKMREAGLKTPVMMLTAERSADDVKRCLQLGARDYLVKPFEERQLLFRLQLLLAPRLRDQVGRRTATQMQW